MFIALHHNARDITNRRFQRLVALGPVDVRATYVRWLCQCDCGTQIILSMQNLTSGSAKSCGCYKRERAREATSLRNRTHGMSETTEYEIWCSMLKRCSDPSSKIFSYYGGRGITVCERWQKFENFFSDMGHRPSLEHSIDRYPNNDGNYELGNVRWATRKEQGRNKRNNRIVKAFGREEPLVSFIGMEDRKRYFRVLHRLNSGWDAERALTEPARGRHAA